MDLSTKVGADFQEEADKNAAYLETAEGRLRLDLTVAAVAEFLPVLPSTKPLRALDLGGGTGAAAVNLARRGVEVTLLDSSLAMLNMAERTALNAEIGDKVVLQHGDVAQAGKLFAEEFFDIVLCHNVLEYVHVVPGQHLERAPRSIAVVAVEEHYNIRAPCTSQSGQTGATVSATRFVDNTRSQLSSDVGCPIG
jgi:ubiquinone/menaquinone biosynthesis C-methylase UbiE